MLKARKGENDQQLNRFNRGKELNFPTRSSLTYLLFMKTPRSIHVTFPACRSLSVPAWFYKHEGSKQANYANVSNEKYFINAENHTEKTPLLAG